MYEVLLEAIVRFSKRYRYVEGEGVKERMGLVVGNVTAACAQEYVEVLKEKGSATF
jgi:hypothetical protein